MPSTIAFNGHTLSSAFQPIYGVREGRAIGYEGLVRATNETGEVVRAHRLFEGLDTAETVSLDRTCRTLHMRSFASLDPVMEDRNRTRCCQSFSFADAHSIHRMHLEPCRERWYG